MKHADQLWSPSKYHGGLLTGQLYFHHSGKALDTEDLDGSVLTIRAASCIYNQA